MMKRELWKNDARAVLSRAHHDYEQALSRHSFFKLGNQALGNDLVQDTFIKTWSYLVKGGKIEVMKAFLYHVLNNLIVDEYRKKKAVSLDRLLEKGFEPSVFSAPDRFSDILDGKKAALLIQKLPEKYRKVIRMRYVQELSLKEISLITGQSKNAITVQSYRGLEKLKALYFALNLQGEAYL
jgi:RNA polymerase sigma-70 factor (ECF subfamily)